MRSIYISIFTAVLITCIAIGWWLAFPSPTPVDELLPDDATIDLDAYAASAPDESGSPEVLILGTTHLAQGDNEYGPNELDQVTESLAAYEPDMVVVEYLPPEYPVGKGRDYRPDFDIEQYADTWEMSLEQADSLVAAHRSSDTQTVDPCTLGRAYFLARDFVNAPYYWLTHDCTEIRHSDEIDRWLDRRGRHEMAQIGYPVAQASGVSRLVSFDYQGDDAEWFIFDEASDQLSSGRLGAIVDFWDILPYVGSTSRQWRAHLGNYEDRLIDLLHFANSPEVIGLQYWAYETVYRGVTRDGQPVGARQTENYWLRNERMFDYMQDAINEEQPERVLVIVGLGHKYFLDELTREAGYRWIDPREWLPSASMGMS